MTKEIKVTCEHCGRYLFTATTTTIVQEAPCTGCGAKSNHKIIFPEDCTDAQLRHVFSFVPTPPKKLKGI